MGLTNRLTRGGGHHHLGLIDRNMASCRSLQGSISMVSISLFIYIYICIYIYIYIYVCIYIYILIHPSIYRSNLI